MQQLKTAAEYCHLPTGAFLLKHFAKLSVQIAEISV